MSELRVLIDEQAVGSLFQENSRLRFVYDSDWRHDPASVPLSLAMPLTQAEHGHKTVDAFLWNLLPDREDTLRQIAAEHGISARNPFALAGVRGEDLPGAIQIVAPERIAQLRKRERIVRISEADLCELLHNRKRAAGRTHIGQDSGFFSLAGAQPKLAVCRVGGRWYEQRGYTPSTHIIKPTMPDLVDQVENEHFCLQLARTVDLPAVRSEVRRIGDLQTIVVARYDRIRVQGTKRLPLDRAGGKVFRIHQEDLCSALSVHPANKYQALGGPGTKPIMRLLEGSGAPDIDRDRFIRACAFNYLVAGVDAHAKNYSVLMEAGGRFRLAPLYDIISALPYNAETFGELAMSIGGEKKVGRIRPRHWISAARDARYDPDSALGHVRDLIGRLPEAADRVFADCREVGFDSDLLATLVATLKTRCRELARIYT